MTEAAPCGVLLVMIDVDPAHEDDFNRWYVQEHLPERIACPDSRTSFAMSMSKCRGSDRERGVSPTAAEAGGAGPGGPGAPAGTAAHPHPLRQPEASASRARVRASTRG